MTSTFEREFFRLAGWMLACNLRVMGGGVVGQPIEHDDFEGALQGMQDSCCEMRLICQARTKQ